MVDWLFKALCSLTAEVRSWFTLSITLFTISGAACCRVSWPEVTWFISCGVQWLVTIITTRGTSSSATEVSSVELWLCWKLIKWSPRTWCEQEEQGRVDDEEQGVNHVKDRVCWLNVSEQWHHHVTGGDHCSDWDNTEETLTISFVIIICTLDLQSQLRCFSVTRSEHLS